jgi:predicted transcriptional regulator
MSEKFVVKEKIEESEISSIFEIVNAGNKVVFHKPSALTIRIEEETRKLLDDAAENCSSKPITLAGMLLEAAIKDFCYFLKADEVAREESDQAAYEAEKNPKKKKYKTELNTETFSAELQESLKSSKKK